MRNEFNLSSEHKTTVDMGKLIPVWCQEVLPGDTFRVRHTALTRVAPLVNPLMHRVELRMHSFYVPLRILWSGWEDFITGEDETAVLPTVQPTRTEGDLLDYMGVPPAYTGPINAYWMEAYNLIWNEFYRDQDLQAVVGLDQNNDVLNCAWQKDYFTIARPQTQQGNPEAIPISGYGRIERSNESFETDADIRMQFASGSDPALARGISPSAQSDPLFVQLNSGSISVDDLRRSIALQRFAEARMRFGSRYVDYLRYLGVNPSDGRLDRPEYLGGGKELLSFSEVLATAETTNANVGDMYGHGIGMGTSRGWQKMFEEHGVVMTLLSCRPKTVYEDSVCRKFWRGQGGPMEFWQKELEVLPWQEVPQHEVDAAGDPATTFGYVPRYEEYRHGVSHVSASMRSTEQSWHMGRDFATPPTLNSSFIQCTPTDRIYQDVNMPDLIMNVQNNVTARRLVGQTASMGVDL